MVQAQPPGGAFAPSLLSACVAAPPRRLISINLLDTGYTRRRRSRRMWAPSWKPPSIKPGGWWCRCI